MNKPDEEENIQVPKNEVDELELIREAMKNESEAWKKLLTNLEKFTSKQEAKNEK